MITPSIKEHQLDTNQLRHQLGMNHYQLRIIDVIHNLELFIALKALSLQPRVIHNTHSVELFITSRARSS